MDFVISIIFYFTTAFFRAITFGNPSINNGMVLISTVGNWKNRKRGITLEKVKNEKKSFFGESLAEYYVQISRP